MRKLFQGVLLAAATLFAAPALPQATTRQCTAVEEPGPACLIARQQIAALPVRHPIFWHIDKYPSRRIAEKAAIATSTVVEAFGSVWLFTIEKRGWRARDSEQTSEIGPLPVKPAATYTAEFLRSVFTVGMTAPLHVHSGPEAFFAVTGDTCLETPQGMRVGRGAGNKLVIEAGPPMLLMAIGDIPRRGFALILHDSSQPPTTLTQSWHPQGFCERQLATDRERSDHALPPG